MKVAVIIPAYNHGQRLTEVINDCRKLELEIIVVDDGSTDQTRAILAGTKGVTVLHHPENRGKGAALLTGFAAAAQNHPWAITLDADGQHDPADAKQLMAAVSGQERALVIGVRQGMKGEHVPWSSRFGRGFSNFWVRLAGGPRVSDSQSGFRLYPLPEVLQLPVQARRYQYEVEVLVRARLQGLSVREVPVQVVYQEGKGRISHFRPFVDFWRNSETFSRLIFHRIMGFFSG